MAEGEKLSKRQLELESIIKRFRATSRDDTAEKEKLAAALAAESAESESLRKTKAKLERELTAAVEAGRAEVEAVRQQVETEVNRAKSEQVGWAMLRTCLTAARVEGRWTMCDLCVCICCPCAIQHHTMCAFDSNNPCLFGCTMLLLVARSRGLCAKAGSSTFYFFGLCYVSLGSLSQQALC